FRLRISPQSDVSSASMLSPLLGPTILPPSRRGSTARESAPCLSTPRSRLTAHRGGWKKPSAVTDPSSSPVNPHLRESFSRNACRHVVLVPHTAKDATEMDTHAEPDEVRQQRCD